MYLLSLVLDLMEVIILQHLYWPGPRKIVQMEVTRCDTGQSRKQSNKKYGKLPAKLAE